MNSTLLFVLAGLVVIPAVAQDNLFSMASIDSLRGDAGVEFAMIGNGNIRVQTAASPNGTPALYFGKTKVTPGQTYTYAVTINGIGGVGYQYVTSSGGDLLWPGTQLTPGVVESKFTVPAGVNHVTLAVAFLYPAADYFIAVGDVGLFEGSPDVKSWSNDQHERAFVHLGNRNLFAVSDTSTLRVEEGIDVGYDDNNLVLKYSGGNTKAQLVKNPTPAAYFGTVKVTPGETYTYSVRGRVNAKQRMTLYVTGPAGNIVWPGDEIRNGYGANKFVVPPGNDEITLAVAFLYCEGIEHAVISDVGLFKGSVNPNEGWTSEEDGGIRPMIKAGTKSRPWQLPALFICLALPFVLFFVNRKSSNIPA